MRHREVLIYTLSHPLTKEIFYIGRTTMSLQGRLICHVTSSTCGNDSLTERIRDIVRSCKTRPTIEEIDRCSYSDRRDAEEYWIQQFAAWGFSLLNRRHYRVRNYVPQERRMKKYAKLTEEEVEMISLLYRCGDHKVLGEMIGRTDERYRQLIRRKTLPARHKDKIIDFYRMRARRIAQWYHSKVA